MALPDLSRLSLREEVSPPTGGAADGRAVAEDAEGAAADLRWPIARVLLESITTLDEACRQLSRWDGAGSQSVRTLNTKVREAMRLALRKDGLGERLAERVMRAEMGLGEAGGLPPSCPTWWNLLQEACRQLTRIRSEEPPLWWGDSFLRRCRTIVLEIVRRDGLALLRVAEHLKRDREVVLAAVGRNGAALQYASEGLRKDREVVLEAVRRNGYALEFASEGLREDKEVVLAAVRVRGAALQWASKELRKDREVVLAAVSQSGYARRYASEELKKDKEVVLAASSSNRQKDKEVVRAAAGVV